LKVSCDYRAVPANSGKRELRPLERLCIHVKTLLENTA